MSEFLFYAAIAAMFLVAGLLLAEKLVNREKSKAAARRCDAGKVGPDSLEPEETSSE